MGGMMMGPGGGQPLFYMPTAGGQNMPMGFMPMMPYPGFYPPGAMMGHPGFMPPGYPGSTMAAMASMAPPMVSMPGAMPGQDSGAMPPPATDEAVAALIHVDLERPVSWCETTGKGGLRQDLLYLQRLLHRRKLAISSLDSGLVWGFLLGG